MHTNCTPWCRSRAQTLGSGQSDTSEHLIAQSGTLWQAFKVAERMRLGQICVLLLKPIKSRELRLSQISAAMYHVSKRFFHRDVNSHNILVQAGGLGQLDTLPSLRRSWQVCTGQLSFGLIDFGLAQHSPSTRSPGAGKVSACRGRGLRNLDCRRLACCRGGWRASACER